MTKRDDPFIVSCVYHARMIVFRQFQLTSPYDSSCVEENSEKYTQAGNPYKFATKNAKKQQMSNQQQIQNYEASTKETSKQK